MSLINVQTHPQLGKIMHLCESFTAFKHPNNHPQSFVTIDDMVNMSWWRPTTSPGVVPVFLSPSTSRMIARGETVYHIGYIIPEKVSLNLMFVIAYQPCTSSYHGYTEVYNNKVSKFITFED
jgi:hypothetical protein